MVRLGAQSVDFATHFLRDEAKLFTLALRRAVTLTLSHCVEEISEMSLQTGLFLGHVKFLYVENHLLFETTFVNLDGIEARKLLLDACLYFGHPFCLIRLYSIQKSAQILYLSDKEIIKFAAFRGAELLKSVDCGGTCFVERLDIILSDTGHIAPERVGHTHKNSEPILRRADTQSYAEFLYLPLIVRHNGFINLYRSLVSDVFDGG